MINQNIKSLLEQTVDYAKTKKIEGCDVITSVSESLSLKAQQNKIDKYDISNEQVIGIRVINNNRVGISYSESFEMDSLKKMVEMAIENAKTADPNEYEKIDYQNEKNIVENNPQLLRHDTATEQDKINLCLTLESEMYKRDPRVKSVPYNGVSETSGQHYFLNSNGTFCFHEERSVSCYTSALMKEENLNSMYYKGVVGRSFDQLDWKNCVEETLNHTGNWLYATAVPTGKYDVVFTRDTFASILSVFSGIYSAKAAQDKVNPMWEKLGQKIAHHELTIIDDPTYKESFLVTTFDDEGFKRKPLTLIEAGTFKNVYHNTSTARFFNTQTTGHASRGARSSLGIGGTTKVVKAGTSSLDQVYDDVVFEVHSLEGLHSGTNFMSGDFSLGCKGYLKKNGEVIQAVKQVTVAGNFYKMLQEIKAIGNIVAGNESKTFFAPLIRFEGLSVAS